MRLPAANAAATRHAHDHGRGELASASITNARELADDLVVRGIDVVRELDLRNRPQPVHRHADRRRDDAAFGDRRIEHAMLAELLLQAIRDPEDSTEIP